MSLLTVFLLALLIGVVVAFAVDFFFGPQYAKLAGGVAFLVTILFNLGALR